MDNFSYIIQDFFPAEGKVKPTAQPQKGGLAPSTICVKMQNRIQELTKPVAYYQDRVNEGYEAMGNIYNNHDLSSTCYHKQDSLEKQIAWGTMSKSSCKSYWIDYVTYGLCPFCESMVENFNSRLSSWKAHKTILANAQVALNQARNSAKASGCR